MGTSHLESERCETCRFWNAESSECHRRAPVTLSLGRIRAGSRGNPSNSNAALPASAIRAWPITQADDWCGEWGGLEEKPDSGELALPIGKAIATRTFLARIASGFDSMEPESLMEALLNQLSPDVRRVIVRMNGLDGQPLSGLKEVAREFRMSREQVRAVIAAGEKRLSEVIEQLSDRRHQKRDA